MAGPSLFDFLGAINNTKENLLETDDPDVLKAFDPFMIRRGLAQSEDTLVIAQKMNLLHKCSPWMQWNMAFHTVQARNDIQNGPKKVRSTLIFRCCLNIITLAMKRHQSISNFFQKKHWPRSGRKLSCLTATRKRSRARLSS